MMCIGNYRNNSLTPYAEIETGNIFLIYKQIAYFAQTLLARVPGLFLLFKPKIPDPSIRGKKTSNHPIFIS